MSNLNKTNLNTNFITNIGADWAAKIADTTWKVGGNTFANIAEQPAKTAYQNEVVQPAPGEYSSETEYSAKVGLMYASDFGFAAAPSAWTTIIRNYRGEAIKNVNWMYMGLTEWTISRVTDRFGSKAANALVAYDAGDIYTYGSNDTISVRPVFNLKSSVTYVSGDGTQNSPIRIN